MLGALLGLAVVLSFNGPAPQQSPSTAKQDAAEIEEAVAAAERQTAIAAMPLSELVTASENLWAAGIDGRPSYAEYQRLRLEIENICALARTAGEDLALAEAAENPDPALLYTRSRIYMIERSACPAPP